MIFLFTIPKEKTVLKRLEPVLSPTALEVMAKRISAYSGRNMAAEGVVNVVILAIDDYVRHLESNGDPQSGFTGSLMLGRLDEIVPALYPNSPVQGPRLAEQVNARIKAMGDHSGRRLALLAREVRR